MKEQQKTNTKYYKHTHYKNIFKIENDVCWYKFIGNKPIWKETLYTDHTQLIPITDEEAFLNLL